MRLRPTLRAFLAYTAVFVVLAGFVFWGTWSLDFAPVMPDSPICYSPNWASEWWAGWCAGGKFVPSDLRVFLGSPYFWQELNYAIPLYLSGLAMAYFLRGRGLSAQASFSAGLLLAFCGYWCTLFSAGHGSWFIWMVYGLFPFGLLDRAIRRGKTKNWLLLGATMGWASYWQVDLWLLFAVFTAAWFLYVASVEFLSARREGRTAPYWKNLALGVAMAAAVFVAIGMPAFLHAFGDALSGRDKQIAEGQTLSQKSAENGDSRWIFVTNWSLPPSETLEFLIPRLNGDTSCPLTLSIGAQRGSGVKPYTGALGRPKDAPRGNYRQHSLYVGFVTILLALAGLALGRRKCAFFAVAAFVFWLLSMGRYCEPVYRVVFALPFGDYLRGPVKWHHLTEFCLVVLAGYGVEGLLGVLGRVKGFGRHATWILAALVVFGACDLARIARLYCAPVDLREARRQKSNLQMTFLRKADFNLPQVQQMRQRGQIVPLAQPNAETYLVGVLEKFSTKPVVFPPLSARAWLSILSMLVSLGVGAFALRTALANPSLREKRKGNQGMLSS